MEYYSVFAIALESKGSNLEERVSGTEIDRAEPGEKPGVEKEQPYIVMSFWNIKSRFRGTFNS